MINSLDVNMKKTCSKCQINKSADQFKRLCYENNIDMADVLREAIYKFIEEKETNTMENLDLDTLQAIFDSITDDEYELSFLGSMRLISTTELISLLGCDKSARGVINNYIKKHFALNGRIVSPNISYSHRFNEDTGETIVYDYFIPEAYCKELVLNCSIPYTDDDETDYDLREHFVVIFWHLINEVPLDEVADRTVSVIFRTKNYCYRLLNKLSDTA